MQQSIEGMLKPSCDVPILEEMYLTGLESFIYYLHGESTFNKETRNIQWKEVLVDETITTEKAKCLCLAIAYLGGPEAIDDNLHNQRVSFRSQIYGSIEKGLRLLEPHQRAVFPKRENIFIITQLCQQISAYQEMYPLEALQEASSGLEDEKSLRSLLEMIQSIVPLRGELLKRLQDEPLTDKETCSVLLKNPLFYNDVYKMVLSWCVDRQNQLISKAQRIISYPLFAQDEQEEKLMTTIASWLLDRTEIALSEHSWKDLKDLENCSWHRCQMCSLLLWRSTPMKCCQ